LSILTGWRREGRGAEVVITFQIAETSENITSGDFKTVAINMSDRQLCSLVRDLRRAAAERGLDPWAHKRRSAPRNLGGPGRFGLLLKMFKRDKMLRLTDGRSPPPPL
jgi:hypothetical protein